MRVSELMRLLGIESRVDAAKDHPGAPAPRQLPNLVPTQRIAGVNANSNNITGMNSERLERLQGFIYKVRASVRIGSGSGQHIQPPRRYDRRPKRHIARIDQMNHEI